MPANATLLASCRADRRSRSFSSVYHSRRAPLPKHCYRQYRSYCRLDRDTQRSGVVHTAYPIVWTHLDRRPETLSLIFVLYAFHRIHTHRPSSGLEPSFWHPNRGSARASHQNHQIHTLYPEYPTSVLTPVPLFSPFFQYHLGRALKTSSPSIVGGSKRPCPST